MVQLKQQIMNLCRFFAGVSGAIASVVQFTVNPFIESIQAEMTGGGGKKLGMYTLTDMTRTVSVSYRPWLTPVKGHAPGSSPSMLLVYWVSMLTLNNLHNSSFTMPPSPSAPTSVYSETSQTCG
jgi:hypothetical protein